MCSSLLLVLLAQGCIQTLDSLAISPDYTFKVELGELNPDEIAQAVVGDFSYTFKRIPSDKSLGVSTIQLTVLDGNGSSVDISIPIEIVNTKSPVLTLNGDAIMYVATKSNWNDPGITMNDPIDGTTELTYEQLRQNDFVKGTIDVNIPGEYLFVYQVKDAIGNLSDSITRTVIVQDLELPTIRFTPTIVLFEGVPISLDDIELTDNIDALTQDDLETTWNGLNKENPLVGTYTVTFQAVDSSNNRAIQNRTYIIIYPLERLFTVLEGLAATNQVNQIKQLLEEYEQYSLVNQQQFQQRKQQFIATYSQQYLQQYNKYKTDSDIFTAMSYLKEMSVFFDPDFVSSEIYRLVVTQVSNNQTSNAWEDALSLIDEYQNEITENQYRTLIRQTVSFMSNATTVANSPLHRRILNRYTDVLGGEQNINYILNSAKITEMVFLEMWVPRNYNEATKQLMIDRELNYISNRDADKLVQDSMVRVINQMFDGTLSEQAILKFASDIDFNFKIITNNWYESYIANLFKE